MPATKSRNVSKRRSKSIGGLWGGAKKKRKEQGDQDFGDLIPVADGRYVAQLVDVKALDAGSKRQILVSVVVIGGDDDGAVCKEFYPIDNADSLVYVQRALRRLGEDPDAMEIDTEEELLGVWRELIESKTCARIQVKTKDGYNHYYFNKLAEPDEDDLYDPEEVVKGKHLPDDAGSDAGDAPAGDDDDWHEGDRVTFGKDGASGVIKGFTEDDEAEVLPDGKRKVVIMDLNELSEEEESGDEPESATDEFPEHGVGARVSVDFDDEPYEGAIKDRDSKGGTVTFDDGDESYHACKKMTLLTVAEPEPEEPATDPQSWAKCRVKAELDDGKEYEGVVTEDDLGGDVTVLFDGDKEAVEGVSKEDCELLEPETGDADADEFEKGDRVIVEVKGVDRGGVVVSVAGDKVKVRLDRAKAAQAFDSKDVYFETDDEEE